MAAASSSRGAQGGDFNLLLESSIAIESLTTIMDQYSLFLLDQFGVLHDGRTALPGAVEAVRALVAAGKPVVVCSNSSQKKELAMQRWGAMGFPTNVNFLTSGDVSREWIKSNTNPHQPPHRVFVFGWLNPNLTNNYLLDLHLTQVSTIEDADLILFHGPETMSGQALSLPETGIVDDVVKRVLEQAAAANLLAVCANMDIKAISAEGTVRFMPGGLARYYESIGGNVKAFGKPQKDFFDHALALGIAALKLQQEGPEVEIEVARKGDGMKNARRVKAIHFGDSLEHDIEGAHSAGIDSCLISNHGIHKDELFAEKEKDGSLLRAVNNLCKKENRQGPTYVMESFRL